MASQGRALWALCWVAWSLQVKGVWKDRPDMDQKGEAEMQDKSLKKWSHHIPKISQLAPSAVLLNMGKTRLEPQSHSI